MPANHKLPVHRREPFAALVLYRVLFLSALSPTVHTAAHRYSTWWPCLFLAGGGAESAGRDDGLPQAVPKPCEGGGT